MVGIFFWHFKSFYFCRLFNFHYLLSSFLSPTRLQGMLPLPHSTSEEVIFQNIHHRFSVFPYFFLFISQEPELGPTGSLTCFQYFFIKDVDSFSLCDILSVFIVIRSLSLFLFSAESWTDSLHSDVFWEWICLISMFISPPTHNLEFVVMLVF